MYNISKVAVCVGATITILALAQKIIQLEKRIKKMDDMLFKCIQRIEYVNQHANDQHSMMVADIYATIESLYHIGVLDDGDLDRLRRQDENELLQRLINSYGEQEGKRRFDIYVGESEEGINLTFFQHMN